MRDRRRGFAAAAATRGLSDRPLDSFGSAWVPWRGKAGYGVGEGKLRFGACKGFAAAAATRGLSDRPLDSFGSAWVPWRGKAGYGVGEGKLRFGACKGFAAAAATRGLSGRPLDSFGSAWVPWRGERDAALIIMRRAIIGASTNYRKKGVQRVEDPLVRESRGAESPSGQESPERAESPLWQESPERAEPALAGGVRW